MTTEEYSTPFTRLIFWLFGIFAFIVVCIYYIPHQIANSPLFCSSNSVAEVAYGVVKVEGDNSVGTGFWVKPEIVLTNNHLVMFNDNLRVINYWGQEQEVAQVVFTDTVRDLALLSVSGPSYHILKWRKKLIKPIETVYAFGYPHNGDMTISKGIVSAITKDEYDDRTYIQTDTAINLGNSGGPLVDKCGNVVGIVSSMLWGAQNISYATIADQVEKRIEEMINLGLSAASNAVEIVKFYQNQQVETVAKYYYTLSEGMLEEAFGYYSLSRQERLPFEKWQEGFENTYFIRLKSVEATEQPNVVKVNFITTDFVNWFELESKEFEGEWTLIKEGNKWKLSESDIKEIEL